MFNNVNSNDNFEFIVTLSATNPGKKKYTF
jgi:hypothetical protein